MFQRTGFIWLILFSILVNISGEEFVVERARCPGLYCGWTQDEESNTTYCGACPHGARPNAEKVCEMCSNSPALYDWLYLGFMALLAPALHWFFIDITNRKKIKILIVLHVSALVECIAAILCTLLVSQPIGSFTIVSCPVQHLSDWYTMLKNPSPDYTTTLHCTQEAVYPLYTIVMIYYAFCLAWMLFLRIVLSVKVAHNKGRKSIYAALYFLPILIVVQAIFSGLIYYSFPYMMLVVSIVTNAIHFAYFDDQNIVPLLKANFTNGRNLVILICHWLLHTYGVIAITQLSNPGFHGYFLFLVPFPTLYYFITVKFTDPSKLVAV